MKGQLIFRNSSKSTKRQVDYENKHNSSCYCSNISQKKSETDLRIEQIKRKYQAPFQQRNNGSSFKQKIFIQHISKNSSKSSLDKIVLKSREPLGQHYNSRDNFLSDKTSYSHQSQRKQNNNICKDKKISDDEIIVFKKIQQMKESIIKDKKRPSFSGKCINERDKYYYPLKQLTNRDSIDPRVKNIDKINNKIRHILDCLNQTQFENQIAKKTQSLSSIKNSIEIKPISRQNQRLSFQETKILQRKLIRYTNDQQIQTNQNFKYEDLNKKESFRGRKEEITKTKQFTHRRQEKNEEQIWKEQFRIEESQQNNLNRQKLNNVRSRSNLQGFYKKQESNKQIGSLSKRDINKQIVNIETRIKHFQNQKRKLKIDFKPFSYEKHNRSFSNIWQKKYEKPPLPKNQNKATNKQRSQQNHIKNQNKQKSFRQIPHKLQQISVRIQTETSNNYNNVSQQFRKKTTQGIENRKQILNSFNLSSKTQQIERLKKCLIKQIQLDELFRNGKMWLDNESSSVNKYEQIKDQMEKKNYLMSLNEIQEQFKLTEEESNPFYSFRQRCSGIVNLVNSYLEAKNNWEDQIIGKFNINQLKNEKFEQRKIDFEKKGFITINDLVRFLNVEGNRFFRNRDLILIWRRLTNSQKLTLQQLYNQLG